MHCAIWNHLVVKIKSEGKVYRKIELSGNSLDEWWWHLVWHQYICHKSLGVFFLQKNGYL